MNMRQQSADQITGLIGRYSLARIHELGYTWNRHEKRYEKKRDPKTIRTDEQARADMIADQKRAELYVKIKRMSDFGMLSHLTPDNIIERIAAFLCAYENDVKETLEAISNDIHIEALSYVKPLDQTRTI